MNIIEKLGIQKGFYNSVQDQYGMCSAQFVESEEMKQLKDTAPEMLEAIIKVSLDPPLDCSCIEDYFIKVIEKACYPKTWEEIESLCQS